MALETHFVSASASAAGANKRHLALFNAAGSGKVIKVFRVQAAGAPAAAVTGLTIALYCTRITSAPTGGTGATISKTDTINAPLPAQITATLAATGGAAEEASFIGCGVVSGEETASANETLLYAAAVNGAQPLTLREGEGVVVKQQALASAGAINVVIQFGV